MAERVADFLQAWSDVSVRSAKWARVDSRINRKRCLISEYDIMTGAARCKTVSCHWAIRGRHTDVLPTSPECERRNKSVYFEWTIPVSTTVPGRQLPLLSEFLLPLQHNS